MKHRDDSANINKNIHDTMTHRHFICWRSSLAGLLISGLIFSAALAAGIGFGGVGLNADTTAANAGMFTGVWILVSVVLALFGGSYFSVRFGRFQTSVVASAQGALIASLFTAIILSQTFMALGAAGRFAGKAAAGITMAAGATVGAMAQNSAVQNMVEDSLNGLKLGDKPEVIVSGYSARLLQGDTESATSYLAAKTGITPADAQARMATLQVKLDEMAVKTREGAAAAMKATGWTLFTFILLSIVSAIAGGVAAAQINFRHPLDVSDSSSVYGRRGEPLTV